MLRATSSLLLKRATPLVFNKTAPIVAARRTFASIEENKKAFDAWQKSCYAEIDYTIPESATVFEAVQRFAAYKIGCLVTTDADGNLSGIVTERDYVTKIAPNKLKSKETLITDIYTPADKLVTVRSFSIVCIICFFFRVLQNIMTLWCDNLV
mmetsp:Transcript_19794/g.29211  ORF Transcript_19794/g.29211 Transcript_19794/m.29211 type:complete len:153 (-) Transcript_19794:73-531(-)